MLKDLFHVTSFLDFERLLQILIYISNYLCLQHLNNRDSLAMKYTTPTPLLRFTETSY